MSKKGYTLKCLWEIIECKGVFSRDPQQHASNVIKGMHNLALECLVELAEMTREEANQQYLDRWHEPREGEIDFEDYS